MAYVKTNWVDNSTPINASNLNKIEDQLEDNTNNIEDNTDEISSINSAITPMYCKATTTTATSVTLGSNVELDDISSQTGEFTLQNNGIKIPSGINHIRVAGSVFLDDFSANGEYLWAKITKNNVVISSFTCYCNILFRISKLLGYSLS